MNCLSQKKINCNHFRALIIDYNIMYDENQIRISRKF